MRLTRGQGVVGNGGPQDAPGPASLIRPQLYGDGSRPHPMVRVPTRAAVAQVAQAESQTVWPAGTDGGWSGRNVWVRRARYSGL